MNPAAMTERLIDAAVYNEEAQGGYVAGARKELNEARAAIEDALSSQSLSLSEAREVIERLREALKPFAAKAGAYDGLPEPKYFGDTDFELNYRPETRVIVTLRDLRHARSALENGPAVLADATSNPPEPDLSSLRKGAEALCPHAPTYDAGLCCGHPDDCTFVSPSGLSKWASATEDGIRAKLLRLAKALHAKHYAHVPQWEPFEDAYGLIDQIDNMTAALVSGSREDGADA